MSRGRYRQFYVLMAIGVWAGPSLSLGAPDLERLFRNPSFGGELSLSPTGDYLAVTLPDGEFHGVVILDISEFPKARRLSGFRLGRDERPVDLVWANSERLLFQSVLQAGDEAVPVPTGRIFASNADGTRQMQVFGMRPGSRVFRLARIIDRMPDDRNWVLINDWATGRSQSTVSRLNIYGQDRTSTVAVSPLSSGGTAVDQQGRPRFAYGLDEQSRQQFAWRPDVGQDWARFDSPFTGDIEFWGFDSTGDAVYIRSRDSERLGVYRVELASRQIEPLLVDEVFEAIVPIFDDRGRELVGAIFATPRPEARFIDPDHPTARRWRSLARAFGDYDLRILNFTADGSRALLVARSDREPGILLMLDAEKMAVEELLVGMDWLDVDELAATQAFEFVARDGVTIHGFLTLPPAVEPRALPLVVEVHGGPHGLYDSFHFDPWVQAMAQSGYAVLRVNFRGSGGRGHTFETAGYQEWGGLIQHDIIDGVRALIETEIAHPERVCISGASFGAYSALMAPVLEPELFRCAFAFAGVYDLALTKTTGIYSQQPESRALLERYLGGDPGQLQNYSPVFHVGSFQADLLLAHGAADEVAPVDHYHALVRALDAAGVSYRRVLFEGEGHGLARLENRIALYGQALELFDRNIGSGWSPEPMARTGPD